MNNSHVLKTVFGLLLLLLCGLAYGDSGTESTANYIESYNGYNSIDLPGMIGGGEQIDVTNIQATKDIIPSGKKNSPDIRLTLRMPPKPAKLDIVLAMDTSGSMIQHYQQKDGKEKTYIDWASEVISSIITHYPDARVSIVSWDDDNEIPDSPPSFFDVRTNMSKIESELNNLSKECLETDHTIYSVGIRRAVQVLDDNPPVDPINTARIIIFVTGLSEFMAEPKNALDELTLKGQLANAIKRRHYNTTSDFNGYQIYTMRIGIDERFQWQYRNLSIISKSTRVSGQPERDPIDIDNIKNLSSALNSILLGLKSNPIAYDVEVIDTLYPYLEYLSSENNKQIAAIEKKNPLDNTTTLRWRIGTMNGNDTWMSLIHTRLVLNLPVEVSANGTEFAYVINNNTPISEVRYRYMTGYRGSIKLPEGEIKLGQSLP